MGEGFPITVQPEAERKLGKEELGVQEKRNPLHKPLLGQSTKSVGSTNSPRLLYGAKLMQLLSLPLAWGLWPCFNIFDYSSCSFGAGFYVEFYV